MAPLVNHPPGVAFVEDRGQHPVNVDASVYYGGGETFTRSRTYSHSHIHGYNPRRAPAFAEDSHLRPRRLSHDEKNVTGPRRFLIDVEETIRVILEQEDTDGDFQISITDAGPKMMALGTATSNGFKTFDIRGTYMLSNLLQELALARDHNRKRIVLDEARLTENPVDRLSRMIRHSFWHSLTRRIDGDGLEIICADPKNRTGRINPRIYVPHGEPAMAEYYRKVARERPHLNLDVRVLPPKPDDPAFVKSLNSKPGILALAMNEVDDGKGGRTLKGIPFIVPGARFNELYNWDSYFISLGLLVDGQVSMAKGMVDHFIFEIKHYGKILNGSRSYYLCRTQPPFLTDMALQIYNQLDRSDFVSNKEWLKRAIQAAIKEYHTVWIAEPRMDPKTGLSRYRPDGLGIPPETEATHFTHILEPYAAKHGISVLEFSEKYNDGIIKEPALDEYFLHDRAVRESGHDTTYRFEKRCANLATIDLQALLYKYEVDIGTAIREVFDDELELEEEFDLQPFPPTVESYANAWREKSTWRKQSSEEWFERAEFRRQQIDRYLWNEEKSLYYDYDTVKERQILYESVTAFWALWAGCASEEQCWQLVSESLKKFEVLGGVVSGTEESRGKISLDRPNRQWDYPYAWPPHQIMLWVGLERYGYLEEAQRLAYRFLYMMTTAFVDFNGVVPEKFDAVKLSHLVDAEYGNQGIDFKMVPREGFGWMNAAYQVGLSFLTSHMRRAVAACTSPEVFFGAMANIEQQFPHANLPTTDPLGLAMENLTISSSAPYQDAAAGAAIGSSSGSGSGVGTGYNTSSQSVVGSGVASPVVAQAPPPAYAQPQPQPQTEAVHADAPSTNAPAPALGGTLSPHVLAGVAPIAPVVASPISATSYGPAPGHVPPEVVQAVTGPFVDVPVTISKSSPAQVVEEKEEEKASDAVSVPAVASSYSAPLVGAAATPVEVAAPIATGQETRAELSSTVPDNMASSTQNVQAAPAPAPVQAAEDAYTTRARYAAYGHTYSQSYSQPYSPSHSHSRSYSQTQSYFQLQPQAQPQTQGQGQAEPQPQSQSQPQSHSHSHSRSSSIAKPAPMNWWHSEGY